MAGHTLKVDNTIDTIKETTNIGSIWRKMYQTKYWYNHFNCVNRSVIKYFISRFHTVELN